MKFTKQDENKNETGAKCADPVKFVQTLEPNSYQPLKRREELSLEFRE